MRRETKTEPKTKTTDTVTYIYIYLQIQTIIVISVMRRQQSVVMRPTRSAKRNVRVRRCNSITRRCVYPRRIYLLEVIMTLTSPSLSAKVRGTRTCRERERKREGQREKAVMHNTFYTFTINITMIARPYPYARVYVHIYSHYYYYCYQSLILHARSTRTMRFVIDLYRFLLLSESSASRSAEAVSRSNYDRVPSQCRPLGPRGTNASRRRRSRKFDARGPCGRYGVCS